MSILLIIILVIIIVIALLLVKYYNELINGRNHVQNAWSQIDVQLQRRNDLIPNIVETVKGYASHEKDTFTKITEARASMANATTVSPVAKVELWNLLDISLSPSIIIDVPTTKNIMPTNKHIVININPPT